MLGINPFAPDAKRSEGSNSAGLPACATDLERPGEEGYGGSETQFDADRRSSTLKACSDALPIDVTPGDETRLRAAAQAQVASTPVRGSLMSAPGRSSGAIMIAPDRGPPRLAADLQRPGWNQSPIEDGAGSGARASLTGRIPVPLIFGYLKCSSREPAGCFIFFGSSVISVIALNLSVASPESAMREMGTHRERAGWPIWKAGGD